MSGDDPAGRQEAVAGADEADAAFIATDRNISRFANSNVHQNMSEVTAELSLRVVIGGAMGVASTTVFDGEELARTAELARDAARYARPLPRFRGLYGDRAPANGPAACDEATASMPAAEKALQLRAMFDRGRRDAISFAGSYTTSSMVAACGNSRGVERSCRSSFADAATKQRLLTELDSTDVQRHDEYRGSIDRIGPIEKVYEGMMVVDVNGEEVGKVEFVKLGDPHAISIQGEMLASWSSRVTITSSPGFHVRAIARLSDRVSVVILGPKATVSGSSVPRNS